MPAMIKRLLLVVALLLTAPLLIQAQTINAASCSQVDVVNALGSVAADGTTVVLPACNVTWSSSVPAYTNGTASLKSTGFIAYNPTYSVNIIGQTACPGNGTVASPIACTDATIIGIDSINANSALLITTAANKSYRFSGITWNGTGSNTAHGAFQVAGNSTQVRVDHMHFVNINYAGFLIDHINGVVDHIQIDVPLGALYNGIKFSDYLPDGNGDTAWTKTSSFGTSDFMFVENSTFNGNNANDCLWGGRYVFRFDTFNGAPLQTHPTAGSLRARGCRAWEIYQNTFTATNCSGSSCSNADFISSGTGLIWANTVPSAYPNFVTLHSDLSDNSTYNATPTPNGWGYCGEWWSGTVNTSGTSVTSASSKTTAQPFGFTMTNANSTVSLAAGEPITINGVQYTIASVSSSTSLTLTTSAGIQNGVGYYIPSVWSGNPNTATGYPCLDMPGRGKSDLITGVFPNVIDSVTGTPAWPNQLQEPIYEWTDVFSGLTFWNVYQAATMVANRDYYLCTTPGTGSCTGFTGDTGVGSGTLAARPSTCTTGVGYWATDQGNWNQSGSGGQGELFVCGAENTWSLYYEPYTYPHPLVSGTGGSGLPPPAAPTNLSAVVN